MGWTGVDMAIEWTDDLATGIEIIDEQHRELYRQVAALHGMMRAADLTQVPQVLAYLERYALEHFAEEERQMAAAKYPSRDSHARHHAMFVDDLGRQKAKLADGLTAYKVVALSTWVGEWLRDHVRKVDGDMARYLRRPRSY